MNNETINNVRKMEKTPLVFLFSAWYPTEFHPLLGNFVLNHAKAISKFAKVIVIYPYEDIEYTQKQKFILEKKQIDNLIEIRIRFKGIKNKTYFAKLVRFIRNHKAYKKGVRFAIQNYDVPDISHVNVLTRAVLPALKLKKKYKIPFIVTEHWTRYLPEDNTFNGYFRKKFVRYAVKQADAITTVSSHLGKAMQNHGLYNDNYHVVPNVFDEDLFYPFAVEKEKKSILHVSSLNYKQKNFAGILQVVNKIAKRRNDFVLNIIHDSDNSVYLPFVKENHLENVVIFHGRKSGKELVRYFNEADFFLLFSNYENLPCVIIESFACGKPVVSTHVGGIAEIVTKERGILIEMEDENFLEQAIEYMLDHFQEYDSEAIHGYAIENFSENAIGEKFWSIYQKVLKQNANA